MSTDSRLFSCPYCHAKVTAIPPDLSQERANKVVCPTCHKPFALYSSSARALRHQDRSTKAISATEESKEGVYLAFMETQFNYPQILQVPVGESILGRYNANSPATLQLDSTDMSLDRQHLRLRLSAIGVLTIQDNRSLTGTYLNGTLLRPQEWRRLCPGDVLTMGATTAIVHLPEDDEFWD